MKIISFDVEEWFHILNKNGMSSKTLMDKYPSRLENEIPKVLDVLEKHAIKCTFFCVGIVAKKYPGIIKRMHNAGHQIGSHSFYHELVSCQTQSEFSYDLKLSIDCLEQITGDKIHCYRAPGFSVSTLTPWFFETLVENGIDTDSSIVFSSSMRYGGFRKSAINEPFLIDVNGALIKEYPIPTKNFLYKKFIYSGGGYFRFFPYQFVKKWTLSKNYVMAYFHYRDFYGDQPILPGTGVIDKFYHYYGITTAFSKFKKYLNDFAFNNISSFDKKINWRNQRTISFQSLLQ